MCYVGGWGGGGPGGGGGGGMLRDDDVDRQGGLAAMLGGDEDCEDGEDGADRLRACLWDADAEDGDVDRLTDSLVASVPRVVQGGGGGGGTRGHAGGS